MLLTLAASSPIHELICSRYLSSRASTHAHPPPKFLLSFLQSTVRVPFETFFFNIRVILLNDVRPHSQNPHINNRISACNKSKIICCNHRKRYRCVDRRRSKPIITMTYWSKSLWAGRQTQTVKSALRCCMNNFIRKFILIIPCIG